MQMVSKEYELTQIIERNLQLMRKGLYQEAETVVGGK